MPYADILFIVPIIFNPVFTPAQIHNNIQKEYSIKKYHIVRIQASRCDFFHKFACSGKPVYITVIVVIRYADINISVIRVYFYHTDTFRCQFPRFRAILQERGIIQHTAPGIISKKSRGRRMRRPIRH